MAGKHLGAKMEPMPMDVAGINNIVPMFRIPDKFRTKVRTKGQPLMSLLPFGIGLGALGGAKALDRSS